METEAESVGYCKYYAPYDRIRDNKPELTCTKDADKYTVNSSIGNGLLDNPVGLITADEMVMAGAPYGSANTEFYMYNTNKFYTSSPYYYCSYQDGARVWNFGNTMKDGVLYGDLVDCSYYARPVINLDSNIRMYGSGTMSDPYRLTKEL